MSLNLWNFSIFCIGMLFPHNYHIINAWYAFLMLILLFLQWNTYTFSWSTHKLPLFCRKPSRFRVITNKFDQDCKLLQAWSRLPFQAAYGAIPVSAASFGCYKWFLGATESYAQEPGKADSSRQVQRILAPLYVYTYIHILQTCIYIYVYIYIDTNICMCTCIYLYRLSVFCWKPRFGQSLRLFW